VCGGGRGGAGSSAGGPHQWHQTHQAATRQGKIANNGRLPAPAATPQRRLDEARAALEQSQNGAASTPPYLRTCTKSLDIIERSRCFDMLHADD
jgi:hypothetical protein